MWIFEFELYLTNSKVEVDPINFDGEVDPINFEVEEYHINFDVEVTPTMMR